MTIPEIQKILKTSFKNGFYIRRPFYVGIEVYIDKNGSAWHCDDGDVFSVTLTQYENKVKDWEIVK